MERLNLDNKKLASIAYLNGASLDLVYQVERYKTLRLFIKKSTPYYVSWLAYWWSMHLGNKDIMIEYVTHRRFVFLWALKIGDREIMRQRLKDPRYCLLWAYKIGDRAIMKKRIKPLGWKLVWNNTFPDDPIKLNWYCRIKARFTEIPNLGDLEKLNEL